MSVKEYDIGTAFESIEHELINSMLRNMKRHKDWEDAEGFNWSMWQTEQLKGLEQYRRQNHKKFSKQFNGINRSIGDIILQARETGSMEQEIEILEAIQSGFKGYKRVGKTVQAEFFRLNNRKLNALIKSTKKDMEKAETAVLRMANDKYRSVIFNAQVCANSGAGTYEKAVDMATKDFLSSGLNCIEYANGARHTISDYADMAIRTASKRAYLTGEGEKRQEWGISTVIVNKRGNPCPKCLPFCGKVLIDDVWSGGKSDGKHQLVSTAIGAGLYHPRCKDSHTTYFDGVSTSPESTYTKKELEEIRAAYDVEQKKRYAARQAEKFGRLAGGSLDPENKKKYQLRLGEWKNDAQQGLPIDIEKSRQGFRNRLETNGRSGLHYTKMRMYAEFTDFIDDSNLRAPFLYDGDDDVIRFNANHPLIGGYDLDYVQAHELSHRMDMLEYQSWNDKGFNQSIIDCRKQVGEYAKEIGDWFIPGGKYEENMAISDIFDALSEGKIEVPFGHPKAYWAQKGNDAAEIFANISAIDTLGLAGTEEFDVILKGIFTAYKGVIRQ